MALDRDFWPRIARIKSEAIQWSLKVGRGLRVRGCRWPAKRQGSEEKQIGGCRLEGKDLVFVDSWPIGCRPVSPREHFCSSTASRRGHYGGQRSHCCRRVSANSFFSQADDVYVFGFEPSRAGAHSLSIFP